jgi:hypothetical protein
MKYALIAVCEYLGSTPSSDMWPSTPSSADKASDSRRHGVRTSSRHSASTAASIADDGLAAAASDTTRCDCMSRPSSSPYTSLSSAE